MKQSIESYHLSDSNHQSNTLSFHPFDLDMIDQISSEALVSSDSSSSFISDSESEYSSEKVDDTSEDDT